MAFYLKISNESHLSTLDRINKSDFAEWELKKTKVTCNWQKKYLWKNTLKIQMWEIVIYFMINLQYFYPSVQNFFFFFHIFFWDFRPMTCFMISWQLLLLISTKIFLKRNYYDFLTHSKWLSDMISLVK